MGRSKATTSQRSPVARTIRFPDSLRERIAVDAERCGRSFEAQVIALLRRHLGENVDIAAPRQEILALAAASLAGVPEEQVRRLTSRLRVKGPA